MKDSIKLNICKYGIGDRIYMGVAAGGMLDIIPPGLSESGPSRI